MLRQRYLITVTAAAAACLAGIVICLLSQTFARTAFSVGIAWTGELARFLAVWAALLGAAAGREAGLLHAVDAFVQRLPARTRGTVAWVRAVTAIGLLLFLVFAGIEMTQRAMPQVSSALQISMAWVYAALPVAATLMLISEIADLIARRPGDA